MISQAHLVLSIVLFARCEGASYYCRALGIYMRVYGGGLPRPLAFCVSGLEGAFNRQRRCLDQLRHIYISIRKRVDRRDQQSLLSSYAHTSKKRSSHILLQAPQSRLGLLEHIVVLADGESQPILDDVGVGISEEFSWWNSGDTQFFDKEVGEFEVAGARSNVGWERVICGEFDLCHVDKDKVAAFRVRVLVMC